MAGSRIINPVLIILGFFAVLVAFSTALSLIAIQKLNAVDEKVAVLSATPTPRPAPTPQLVKTQPLQPGDHVLGSRTAPVLLIEYSDTECPYCKAYEPTINQVKSDYGDQVAIVYRYYPLSFHQNAEKEAEALQCVYEQGGDAAFFRYLSTIFERTTSNGTGFALDQLAPLAKEQGLDSDRLTTCLDSGKEAALVQADEKSGTDAGVTGTPATVVYKQKDGSGRLIEGAVTANDLKQAINTALQ
ncbi:DsbA family protein [Patescibacteria group bacterium]|nr:DsbA family protein [Patescibacteria group bacterium]